MEFLHKGSEACWLFATIAAGMGMDIPDIEVVVIFGIDGFNSTFQKGSRAGRNQNLQAKMIWIVEPWAFETAEIGRVDGRLPSKKALADAKQQDKMDPTSREYINWSQSTQCMRSYAVDHLRPKPNLPGFPWFKAPDELDWDGVESHNTVTWDVDVQEIATGGRCGCSSLACCVDPTIPVGVLSESEQQLISHHIQTLRGIPQSQGLDSPSPGIDSTMSITYAEAGPLCCSKAEKDILRQALLSWCDSYWVKIRNDYPFFSRNWVITNEYIGRLVDKACILLNTPQVDVAIVRSLIKCISDDTTMTSLVCVLQEFCDMRRE